MLSMGISHPQIVLNVVLCLISLKSLCNRHFRLTDSLDLMQVSRLVSVLDAMGRSVVTLPPLNRKNLVTTNQNCGLSHHTTLEGIIV